MTNTELNQKIDDFWGTLEFDVTFVSQVDAILKVEDEEFKYALCDDFMNRLINDIIFFYGIYFRIILT